VFFDHYFGHVVYSPVAPISEPDLFAAEFTEFG